jgi:hypothetical protein
MRSNYKVRAYYQGYKIKFLNILGIIVVDEAHEILL